MDTSSDVTEYRLTGFAHGGGCACKIPPGELEDAVRGAKDDLKEVDAARDYLMPDGRRVRVDVADD